MITQSALGVQLPNGVQLAAGAQGNQLNFGSPNGETGLSIFGASGIASLRYSAGKVKLVVGPAGGPPPDTNGIVIDTAGSVGIGTQVPASTLDVYGTDVGRCGPVVIGWGGRVQRGCGSALSVTTDNVSANLIQGINPSGSVFVVNGSGNVGIGTLAPLSNLDVRGNVFVGLTASPSLGANALFLANDSGDGRNDFRVDAANNTLYIIARSNPGSGAGVGIVFRTAPAGGGEIDRVGINGDGTVRINVLGGAGATDVCRNADFALSTCSSSLRYKSDVRTFTGGLDIVSRLRPISFNWKQGGIRDVGFGAEEVEKVEPLLATFNDKGEIEGVKYKQITTVLVNAVKEQQAQLQQQQKLIEQLQTRLTRIERNAKRSQGVRRRSVR